MYNYLLAMLYGEQLSDETKTAIEEARSGKSAGTLKMDNFEAFMQSLNGIE